MENLQWVHYHLSKYGKITEIGSDQGNFILEIREGFSIKATTTFKFLKEVEELTGFTKIVRLSTDKDFCSLEMAR